MKIYKYRSIDQYIEKNILLNEFVYSRVKTFNDPFEVSPNYLIHLDEYHKEYFDSKPFEFEQLQSLFYNQSAISLIHQSLFVASFTQKCDDILMWSHYADSHKGLCFEFDIPDSKLANYQFMNVLYSDSRVTMNINLLKSIKPETLNDETYSIEIKGDLKPLYIVKSLVWKHEHEIRLIYKDKTYDEESDFVTFVLPYLTHIYLGVNIPSSEEKKVLKLAKKVGVSVSKMCVDKELFKLNPVIVPPEQI